MIVMKDVGWLVAAFLVICVGGSAAQHQSLAICTKSYEEQRLCEKLKALMSEDMSLDEYGQIKVIVKIGKPKKPVAVKATVDCVQGIHAFDCVDQIRNGQANVAKLTAQELYGLSTVPEYADFHPIAAGQTVEKCSYDCHKFAEAYAVALVKKSSGVKSLNDLHGLRACFSKPGSPNGWIMATAVMRQNWTGTAVPLEIGTKAASSANEKKRSSMRTKRGTGERATTLKRCPDDFDIIAELFGLSCVPGSWSYDNLFNSSFGQHFCSVCPDGVCDSDVSGTAALDCLTQTEADVAFVSSDAVRQYFRSTERDRIVYVNEYDKYGLVCKEGLKQNIFEHEFCNLGALPEFVYVATVNSRLEPTTPIQAFGKILAALFGLVKLNKDYYDDLHRTFLGDNDTFAITDLAGRYGSEVPDAKKYLAEEGAGFLTAMEHAFPTCKGMDRMRFCILNGEEHRKCQQMSMAWSAAGLPQTLECIVGYTEEGCVRLIKRSLADVTFIPVHRAYAYVTNGTVKPLMKEVLQKQNPVYAVAVALTDGTVKSLKDIQSGHLRVCSSGTDSFAGWEAPNSVLKNLGIINADECALTEKWALTFMKSCVPGAKNTTVTLGRNSSNPVDMSKVQSLCDHCSGGPGRCLTPSQATDTTNSIYDRYYGDIGALRCLVQRKGQVAFLRHPALQVLRHLESIGDPDFRNIRLSQFTLLCPDGTASGYDAKSAKKCNIGQMPDRIMVARGNVAVQQLLRWQDFWIIAQNRARDSFDWFRTHVSFLPGKANNMLDLIFSNNTERLERFDLNTSSLLYQSQFGRDLQKKWNDPFKCNSSSYLSLSILLLMITLVTCFINNIW